MLIFRSKTRRFFKLEFYEITLRGMHKILRDFKEDQYADIVEKCIGQWQKKHDAYCMLQEFADNGRFRTFKFNADNFSSVEQNFWVQQLFGGLVAMMIQLAQFANQNKNISIDFIRKNFGMPTDVLTGIRCTSCGQRQTSLLDIDKYISLPIIAKRIADGLEKGSLDDEIDMIVNVSAPEIERERSNAKLRTANTNIPVFDSRNTPVCPSCGNKKFTVCKFLKSVKEPIFIPLNS